jgi:hypothetical protein
MEVIEGVKDGEEVVVAANFLIDAESNLKAAIGGFGHPRMVAHRPRRRKASAAPGTQAAGHQAEGTVDSVDAKAGTVKPEPRAGRQPEVAGDDHGVQGGQSVAAVRRFKPGVEGQIRVRRAPARRMGHHRRQADGGRQSSHVPGRQSARRPLSTGSTMLSNIIDWSGRNRFLVLLATLFIVVGGVFAVLRTPIDALPDLSDVQVIVYTEYPGQAPQVVEDQVTYPLTTAMLSVPKSKVVRGFSFFGASFVYIIFEDGTDIYWARSRVLEYLNFASGRMPKGITPQIGPDATGVGLGLSVRVAGQGTRRWPNCAPSRTGSCVTS